MRELDFLTEKDITSLFTPRSWSRARSYFRNHRVRDARRQGTTLLAKVQGARLYTVEIEVADGRVDAICSCPYDWGGYCKHVGAVLLTWIHRPQEFSVAEVEAEELEMETQEAPPPPGKAKAPWWLDESFEARRDQMLCQLRKDLSALKMQQLRNIAWRRGWHIRTTRKDTLTRSLAPRLVDQAEMARVVAGLSLAERQALQAVLFLDNGEGIIGDDIAPVLQVTRKDARELLTSLVSLGLLMVVEGEFYIQEKHVYGPRYWLPAAIRASLPPLAEAKERDAPPSDHVVASPPYALLTMVHHVWQYMAHHEVHLRPPMPRPRMERFHRILIGWDYVPAELTQLQGRDFWSYGLDAALTIPPARFALNDEAMARLTPLCEGEPELVDFIYHLLLEMGLIAPGSPVTVQQDAMYRFLRHSEAEQQALLARTYFRMESWSEMDGLRRRMGQLALRRSIRDVSFTPAKLRSDLLRARNLVLRACACLPDHAWADLEELLRPLRTVWTDFSAIPPSLSIRYRSKARWWAASETTGQRLHGTDLEEWDVAQGNFVRAIIEGPLYWLGLVELCRHQSELVALRPLGLADLLWDRRPVAVPEARVAIAPEDAISVDTAAMTITVRPSAISVKAHNLLDHIARLEEAAPGRFIYRLSAQAVHETFESGLTLEELLHLWEELLPIPLPKAMRERLASWWASYGHVRLYENLTLIEFADDFTLRELKAGTSLGQHIIAEISPRLVIIPRSSVKPLMEELVQRGYTPKEG